MANKRFCDICNLEIVGQSNAQCEDCGRWAGDFHAPCLTVIYNKLYCNKHETQARNRAVIAEYLKKIWNDVGLSGEICDRTGCVKANIGPLTISIDSSFDRESKTLNEIEILVEGLATKVRKFNASLHDHIGVVNDLRQSIVRSLRSSKSAIAVQQKNLRTKLTEIDILIKGIIETSDEADPI